MRAISKSGKVAGDRSAHCSQGCRRAACPNSFVTWMQAISVMVVKRSLRTSWPKPRQSGTASFFQANPFHYRDEAGVRTQAIPSRVRLQFGQPRSTFFYSFFEPIDVCRVRASYGVVERNRQRRSILAIGEMFPKELIRLLVIG